jgi:hypothetical protein
VDAGESLERERGTLATHHPPSYLNPLIKNKQTNTHHLALAEQALAKVRAAVDALDEDAWMYEAPRHASTH